MTIKEFILSTLVVITLAFIGGFFTCRSFHKELKEVVYDITHLRDSILATNKTHDTIIIKEKEIITNEKPKIKIRYVAVDSLSFDSLFELWQESARQYKPLFN